MKLDRGFYTALGTPLDADGRVLARSLCDEIERMTAAGTSGLLLLGSMGMQPAVAPDECAAAAKIAACQNAGRTPLFVGVMDNSIRAVCAHIDALRGLPVDGVVLTPPYYYGVAPEALRNFYHSVADFSPFPVFLYDLPVATKIKLTYPMVAQLQKHPNIRGIKTADLPMILELQTDAAVKKDFTAFYSGLDTVHVGVQNGVCRYLDGMFSCAPRTAQAMEGWFARGKPQEGLAELRGILSLRDTMASFGIFSAYTAVMNLLGIPGRFATDYECEITPGQREILRSKLQALREL